ncbi:hypothetical protein F4778DRAFT_756859 [Xylariomycetidae sp. FL2044]|nr:hypothetical protein F4778DRAFT_756859 [Xylariomycetidae sp. FL2044]
MFMLITTFLFLALLHRTPCVTGTKLLSGGTIVAFDEASQALRVIRNGSLVIQGDQIAAISESAYPDDIPDGTEIIDCSNKIITPGFVDTHRHGWQTVYKTLGANTTLSEYVSRFGANAGLSLFTPEDVYISQLAGIYEALNAGSTTMLDHAHHTWTPEHAKAGLDATLCSGARVFFAYAFQNATPEFGVPEQISQWRELARTVSSNLTTLAMAYDDWTDAPTGTNTVDIMQLARESNVSVITTHHVEGPWLFGNTPEDLHRVGILNSSIPIVISHASSLTARGAQLLRSTNQHISMVRGRDIDFQVFASGFSCTLPSDALANRCIVRPSHPQPRQNLPSSLISLNILVVTRKPLF